jgi:HAD superfamily phosphatase
MRILVFDMDGVLVDVGDSYRETIQQTVEHFTGRRPSREEIQEWKNRGGWNDDWMLSTAIIRQDKFDVEYTDVVDHFQKIFHGENGDGLITREKWIARNGLFDALLKNWTLAVFTGRMRWEARLTLDRFAPSLPFDPIVGADDIDKHKPAPDGLLKIAAQFPGAELWYVGDTIDDARSAKAAGVPFIGVAEPGKPKHQEIIGLLEREGARAVIHDINQLEGVLPA